MRTVRLYVDQPLSSGQRLALSTERSRYLTQSLRLTEGATVNLFNERDGEFSARIDTPRKRATVVAINEPVAAACESPLNLTLAQSIGRGDRMDYAVQKATELGVRRIQPLITARTEVRLSGTRAEDRRRRWEQIARAACEQCGRTVPPGIAAPAPLTQWIAQEPRAEAAFVLDPEAAQGLRIGSNAGDSVSVAVGPEGGWAPEELAAFGAAGHTSVRVGPRTLRTETAAAIAVALLQAQAGDLLT